MKKKRIEQRQGSCFARMRRLVIGSSRNPLDKAIFHKISLIAFLAWVGLGADGLSSSCYGPQEAFLALNGHAYLSLFVGLGTVLTIFVISSSYSQIVELFSTGGGGYLVASKLLSPSVGMISGCALLVDYVLTVAVSIASGADAIFSLVPAEFQGYKLMFTFFMLLVMVVLNMRGIKESVLFLTPIFLTFVVTHLFIIFYAVATHAHHLPALVSASSASVKSTVSSMGFWGMFFLILRAYSMGAGTFTGIEAVSNGVPILREPKVRTAKSTMRYMAISLAVMAMGLMLAYLLYHITLQPGKTFNAVLFEQATSAWPVHVRAPIILISLISEAALLFVAAQAGFLDGPRVLANMARDRWFPTRFSTLSDRLVTQNGILIMGISALLIMFFSRGSVQLLVVLYSINVFITFILSQLGMVRHWWDSRGTVKNWAKKLSVNGIGLVLSSFILVSMIVIKFHEGGWVTLLITGALVVLAIFIKRHYYHTARLLHRLNGLMAITDVPSSSSRVLPDSGPVYSPGAKTAVLLVSGFNGMGLHTLFGIIRLFGHFRNFVFIQIGIIDAGNFKGTEEVDRLQAKVSTDLSRYITFVRKQGFFGEGISAVGVDVVEEVSQLAPQITERFPQAVFFGGQLIFPKDSFIHRILHNHTVFTLQKKLYRHGLPFVILPIRV